MHKAGKVLILGNMKMLLSTGTSRWNERQMVLWDQVRPAASSLSSGAESCDKMIHFSCFLLFFSPPITFIHPEVDQVSESQTRFGKLAQISLFYGISYFSNVSHNSAIWWTPGPGLLRGRCSFSPLECCQVMSGDVHQSVAGRRCEGLLWAGDYVRSVD